MQARYKNAILCVIMQRLAQTKRPSEQRQTEIEYFNLSCYRRPFKSSGFASAAESAFTALAGGKLVHNLKRSLDNRHNHHLRDALHRLDGKRFFTTVPQRDLQFALIIRVNQTDQVTQNNTVFMTQARTRQQNGCVSRVGQMHRQTGRHEIHIARLQYNSFIQAGTQVQTGGTGRCISRAGNRPFSDLRFSVRLRFA